MSGGHSKWKDVKAAARRRRGGRSNDSVTAALAADVECAERGRQVARAAGRTYAEPIDLGVSMDVGAPLPHLVTDGQRAVLIFHAGLPPNPDWDGTIVTVVDPGSPETRRISWVIFEAVRRCSLGPPDDEAVAGHPLFGVGLRHYQAHEVRNSELVEPSERGYRVHMIITFHDETFECVCGSWTSGVVETDFATALRTAALAMHSGPKVFLPPQDSEDG